jgi:hypothetical protein
MAVQFDVRQPKVNWCAKILAIEAIQLMLSKHLSIKLE